MPRLPSPDQIQQQRFQPAQGIVETDVSAPAKAMQSLAGSVQRGMDTVDKYMDDTAELHAREAMVELKRKENQLAVGQDGYAQLRNGAATSPGVLQKYNNLHEQAIQGLSTGLSSRAKQKFEAMAKESSVSYQSGVLKHIMKEDMNHRGEVYKAQVAVSGETMGLNYNNPDAVARGRAEIDTTVAEYIQKNGITDPALQERMLQDARGVGHKQVVEGYVQAGDAKAAEQYFKSVSQEMTPETRQAVDNMLKPQVAHQAGREVANQMFQMHLSGASESEIFEEKLRLTENLTPQAMQAADQIYNNQVKAREADRVNRSGEILLSFYNGEGGSGVNDPRLREIDAADPTFGVQIREKMDLIARRRQAAAKAAQAGEPENPQNMVLYAEAVDSIQNGQETEASIVDKYAGKLKDGQIRELVKRVASREDKAASYRINSALVNAGMPKSADDAERKAAYKGFVETKLQEWKDNNPGKIPTPQEERAIINSASQEHVEVGRFWNSKVEAYRAEGRTTYPKRMESLLPNASEDQLIEAYSFLQNIRARRKPTDPNWSDAEILNLWQERQR